MPVYLVERAFAEQVEATPELTQLWSEYEADHEIRWLTTFLSADKKRTYCLYEVADVELLRRHAEDLGLPYDTIVEVSELQR